MIQVGEPSLDRQACDEQENELSLPMGDPDKEPVSPNNIPPWLLPARPRAFALIHLRDGLGPETS